MPFLEEQPLDAAWPAVEAAAARVTVHDMSPRSREVGQGRSNWKVCTQNIPAGSPYQGLVIDFGVGRAPADSLHDAFGQETCLHRSLAHHRPGEAASNSRESAARGERWRLGV
jgi:hypothetical protein